MQDYALMVWQGCSFRVVNFGFGVSSLRLVIYRSTMRGWDWVLYERGGNANSKPRILMSKLWTSSIQPVHLIDPRSRSLELRSLRRHRHSRAGWGMCNQRRRAT